MKYKVQNTLNGEYLDDDSIFLLPNGEVGYFIKDGSYPHYRKFQLQDDFKVINTECERLQKQLEIAVKALEDLTNSDNWSVEQIDGECVFCFNMKYPWRFTGEALKKIKDLEK